MSEGTSSGPPSPVYRVLRTLRFFSIAMMLVVAAQLVLNPAHKRPHVLCWPIYLSGSFFGVTVVRTLLPGEPLFAFQNVMRMERFYDQCVALTGRFPGFDDPGQAGYHVGGGE